MTQPRHTQLEGEPLALPTARGPTQANQATAKKLKHFIWFIKFHVPKASFEQGGRSRTLFLGWGLSPEHL